MFTPVHTAIGALMLHEASTAMMEDHGRVLGVSGMIDGILGLSVSRTDPKIESETHSTRSGKRRGENAESESKLGRIQQASEEKWFRLCFLLGLLLGPSLLHVLGLNVISQDVGMDMWASMRLGRIGIAGFLVGLGSKLGSGCTSGHMLCGLSRLSIRSILAVSTFFPIAMFAANFATTPFSYPNLSPIEEYKASIEQRSTMFSLIPNLAIFMPVILYPAFRRILWKYLSTKSGSTSGILFRPVPYFLIGLVFSLGLLVSGMASPKKVMAFLLFPNWEVFDPSLILVMLFGVLPNGLTYFRSSRKPRFEWEAWRIPTRKDIDWRLILGASAFGVGWGLCGVCPGPAIVAVGEVVSGVLTGLAYGNLDHLVSSAATMGITTFAGSMVAGMAFIRFAESYFQ